MSDTTKPTLPSQYQLRAELESYVLGDLLGPAGGESEELTERTVRDRYLVGVLAPSRAANAAAKPAVDEEEDEEIPHIPDELSEGGNDTADDGKTDADMPVSQAHLPSSFGMSFCVDSEAKAIKVDATWGQYKREKREDVIHALARYLGFARVTDISRDAIKSAINSANRQGIHGYEGSVVWREE